MKPARRNTHNCQVVPVQANGLAQNLWVTLIPLLPHLVADYGNRVGSWLVNTFFRQKRPPNDRLHLQHIEVIRGHQLGPGALCFPFFADA